MHNYNKKLWLCFLYYFCSCISKKSTHPATHACMYELVLNCCGIISIAILQEMMAITKIDYNRYRINPIVINFNYIKLFAYN